MEISQNISTDLIKLISEIKFVFFDFDGVFTNNTVYVFEDGRESVRCSRADGLGLARLSEVGVDCTILSTEKNQVVSHRAKKLKIKCIQDCENKKKKLLAYLENIGLKLQEVAFVGNDINDQECLKIVGFPVVVADAHPEVIDIGKYVTLKKGGDGAVREICDLIFHVKQEAN